MKKYIALTALLLSGVAGQAFAQSQASVSDCSAPAFTWQRLGGDPFAASEAEAMRKLPEALAHAVAAGCMPQSIADNFATQVKENPRGAEVTIVPGAKLAFMESGKHPIMNVTVGTTVVSAGTGLVVAITARAWRARDEATGITYQWMMPYVCFNWSLTVTPPEEPVAPPPPPPPPENDCVVNNYAVARRTDGYGHIAGIRVDVDDECTAYRLPGETAWIRVNDDCEEDCFRDERTLAIAREKVGNVDITFSMKVPVTADGVIQVRTSRRSTEAGSGIALWACLELRDGRMSDGVLTRYDDYHYYAQWNQDIATVFRTQSSIPDDWSGRQLYFRFSQQ